MKYVCLLAIRFYKRFLSKHTPTCWLKPSCSSYAYQVISQHGARVGLQLTVDHVTTCRQRYQEALSDSQHPHHHQARRFRAARELARAVPG